MNILEGVCTIDRSSEEAKVDGRRAVNGTATARDL